MQVKGTKITKKTTGMVEGKERGATNQVMVTLKEAMEGEDMVSSSRFRSTAALSSTGEDLPTCTDKWAVILLLLTEEVKEASTNKLPTWADSLLTEECQEAKVVQATVACLSKTSLQEVQVAQEAKEAQEATSSQEDSRTSMEEAKACTVRVLDNTAEVPTQT